VVPVPRSEIFGTNRVAIGEVVVQSSTEPGEGRVAGTTEVLQQAFQLRRIDLLEPQLHRVVVVESEAPGGGIPSTDQLKEPWCDQRAHLLARLPDSLPPGVVALAVEEVAQLVVGQVRSIQLRPEVVEDALELGFPGSEVLQRLRRQLVGREGMV